MYNKLSIALATIAVITITVVLVIAYHAAPFSQNFSIAFSVMLFSETLLGGFLIYHMGLSEVEFSYAIGSNLINICYCLFAFGMLFATNIQTKYFAAWQIVALLIVMILHIVFRIAEHNIRVKSKIEDNERLIQKSAVRWR